MFSIKPIFAVDDRREHGKRRAIWFGVLVRRRKASKDRGVFIFPGAPDGAVPYGELMDVLRKKSCAREAIRRFKDGWRWKAFPDAASAALSASKSPKP